MDTAVTMKALVARCEKTMSQFSSPVAVMDQKDVRKELVVTVKNRPIQPP